MEIKKEVGLFAGSFDPITLGHIDLIKRFSASFDKIIVLLAINPDKKTLFSIDDRMKMIKASLLDNNLNCEVYFYDGLTVDFAKSHGCKFLLRGIRNETDKQFEEKLASQNKELCSDIKTVYLTCSENFKDVSSSLVRKKIKYKEDISKLVSKSVVDFITDKKSI